MSQTWRQQKHIGAKIRNEKFKPDKLLTWAANTGDAAARDTIGATVATASFFKDMVGATRAALTGACDGEHHNIPRESSHETHQSGMNVLTNINLSDW